MGCDIHMYVEVKKNDLWEKAGKIFDYPYYDPDAPSQIGEDGYEWNPRKTDEPYMGRNYDLFAILANVRNGYGFAGIPTGRGFKPIDMPRGLPRDVSKEIKKLSDEWGLDGHSHSYFTLKEILDYDWDQVTTHELFVNETGYDAIQRGEQPAFTCAGVHTSMVISEEEMKDVIKRKKEEGQALSDGLFGGYWTHVSWEETYRSCARVVLENTIPELLKLGNPEDVRIVFWFDN
ncbi:MAG: hypothetical protein ACTSPB_03215 [Candidatus Thorarchaeota archaeon]